MKKTILCALVAISVFLFSSCSVFRTGLIYEGVTKPFAVTSNPLTKETKVGVSSSISVLGIVAVGDGGINTAAKNGGVTKINVVDVKTTSILGLFSKEETVVYGE